LGADTKKSVRSVLFLTDTCDVLKILGPTPKKSVRILTDTRDVLKVS